MQIYRDLFFLERVGELRIIILRKKERVVYPPSPQKKLQMKRGCTPPKSSTMTCLTKRKTRPRLDQDWTTI